MKLGLQSRPSPSPDAEKSLIPGYPLLDWLRFALASVVVLSHSGVLPWQNSGNLAVQVFFALSGWLIGGILIKGDAKLLPLFYFNRVTRIWIPYFAAVTLIYATSAAREPVASQWLRYLFFDVTFTHYWFSISPWGLAHMPLQGTGNHFWSLSVEEQFYLLSPLLVYSSAFGRKSIAWLIVSLALILIGQTSFASLAAGVSAACARREYGDWHLKGVAPVFLSIALTVSFALCFFAYGYAAPPAAASAVLLLARPGHRQKFGTFLGAISYPMYLNNWIGAFAAHEVTRHLIPTLAPAFAALDYIGAVIVGALAYVAIDYNVMRERKHWYSTPVGIALAATAYLLLFAGLYVGLTMGLKVR